MDYTIKLRSDEPCDVFLTTRGKTLYAIIVESRTAYKIVLDSNFTGVKFTLVCSRHSFAHRTLVVTIVDDFALVDGSACYEVSLSEAAKEVLTHEISCR